MKKGIIGFLLLTVIFVLAACGNDDAKQPNKDIKELVNDYTVGEFADDVSASINSHELIVTEAGKETKYELPKDEFFVSIAPFKTTTHECAIHSLTGCQGELVEESLDVVITDDTGEVIVDETMQTFTNGFIDLWLPRDGEFTVTITQGDDVAEQKITTYQDDYTCITTMQLVAAS